MSDMKKDNQRPEGALVEAAMKSAGMSGRKLAEQIGFSEGRVRQIVNGYKTEGGQVIPVVGPADTVARMAEAVGIVPEEIRRAGRADVADEMNPLRAVGVTETGDLWISDDAPVRAELRAWLDRVDSGSEQAPPTEALTLWDFEQLLEAVNIKHQDELRLKDYFIELLGKEDVGLPPEVVEMTRAKGGDGDADSDGSSAPNRAPRRPADEHYLDDAAYDPEKDQ